MQPVRMTEESIKGYGQLLSANSKQLTLDEPDFSYMADVGRFFIEGNMTTGILTGKKRALALDKMERHVRTPELLVALENDFLIALAKPCEADKPDPEHVNLFHVKQGDAFVLDRGTWHWVPFPIEAEECKLLVVFRENTGVEDGGVISYFHSF